MIGIVIGLGSMGKRRIRLINKYNKEIKIIGIDIDRSRRDETFKKYNIETYENLEEIEKGYKIDFAFVCTSPLSHSKIITECLRGGIHVFTELNLVDYGYEKNIRIAKENKLVLFMSSTFIYREEIKVIKSLVGKSKDLLNYTYHVGQYLPDWHPWENYKDFFVANKATNACRELFAIELPWIVETFGNISKLDVVKSKISNLEIDYNDNYLITIQHDSGHKGTLALDIISRKAVRNLEIFGERLYMSWDGSPEGLIMYDYENKVDKKIKLYEEVHRMKDYSDFVVENAYLNEIVDFFEVIEKKKKPIYSFEKDKKILKIIDEIEA